MKSDLKVKLTPEQLPATPIAWGTELYSEALALARAAGAVGPNQEPINITYLHATRAWQVNA